MITLYCVLQLSHLTFFSIVSNWGVHLTVNSLYHAYDKKVKAGSILRGPIVKCSIIYIFYVNNIYILINNANKYFILYIQLRITWSVEYFVYSL